VITGRERHDAAAPLVGAQREQLVESAADLKRAGALEVFALEETLKPLASSHDCDVITGVRVMRLSSRGRRRERRRA